MSVSLMDPLNITIIALIWKWNDVQIAINIKSHFARIHPNVGVDLIQKTGGRGAGDAAIARYSGRRRIRPHRARQPPGAVTTIRAGRSRTARAVGRLDIQLRLHRFGRQRIETDLIAAG